MECFWLWAPFKQLQYLWKNNLTNFIEICKSPEVGPTSFSGLLPLVSGVLLLYLTHLLDPFASLQSLPVTPTQSYDCCSLVILPSPVHPTKIISDLGIKSFPGRKGYHSETLVLGTIGALHEICVLAASWKCSLLDFTRGESAHVTGPRSRFLFIKYINSLIQQIFNRLEFVLCARPCAYYMAIVTDNSKVSILKQLTLSYNKHLIS